jgi:hypothetical protein
MKIEIAAPSQKNGSKGIQKLYLVVFWEAKHFTAYLSTICPSDVRFKCKIIQDDRTHAGVEKTDITEIAKCEENAWRAVWPNARKCEDKGDLPQRLDLGSLIKDRGIVYALDNKVVVNGTHVSHSGQNNILEFNGSGLDSETYFAVWSRWRVPFATGEHASVPLLKLTLEIGTAIADISIFVIPPVGMMLTRSTTLSIDQSVHDANCMRYCGPDPTKYLTMWQTEHHIMHRRVYKVAPKLALSVETDRVTDGNVALLEFMICPETPGVQIVTAVYVPIFASFLASYGVDGQRLDKVKDAFWPALKFPFVSPEAHWLILVVLLFLNLIFYKFSPPNWSQSDQKTVWTLAKCRVLINEGVKKWLPIFWFWTTIGFILAVIAFATVQGPLEPHDILAILPWLNVVSLATGFAVLLIKIAEFGPRKIIEFFRALPSGRGWLAGNDHHL